MSRQATGSKQWRNRAKTWVGRVRGDDGKRSEWVDLCTNDETIAAKRLEDWVRTGEPPSQAGKETFRKAAERILHEQAAKLATSDRRHRVRAYAYPIIGHIEIAELKPPQIRSVLTGMDRQRQLIAARAAKVGVEIVAGELGLTEATLGKWVRALERQRQNAAAAGLKTFSMDTVHHMRVDISRILGALVLEGAIASNVAEGVELPDEVEYDDRRFVVLNDEECRRLWRRGFDSELMMASLISREFAAQRTSDLLAADWEDYALGDCTTAELRWTAIVRRPKTDDQGSTKHRKRRKRRVTIMYERVRLRMPPILHAPLEAWRERQRDPITGALPRKGPIFPAQRGPNAGKRKASRGNSWAEPLRDALWAEGIVRPLPGYETATGEERRKYCALQVDTEHTRAAVFHSFRRASVTALRKAGVPLHIAMLITGHQSLPTHMGYNDTEGAIDIPAAASAMFGELAGLPSGGPPRSEPPSSRPTPPTEPPSSPAAAAVSGALPGRAGAANGEVTGRAPGVASSPAAALAAILAQLAAHLGKGGELPAGIDPDLLAIGVNGVIDPDYGSMASPLTPNAAAKAAKRQARPCGFEPQTYGSGERRDAPIGAESLGTTSPEVPDRRPSEGVLTPIVGQSMGATSPQDASHGEAAADGLTAPIGSDVGGAVAVVRSAAEPVAITVLASLEATARTALADHNWALLEALRPLIEAEAKRAAAVPISLAAVRAKRGERGQR